MAFRTCFQPFESEGRNSKTAQLIEYQSNKNQYKKCEFFNRKRILGCEIAKSETNMLTQKALR